MSPRNEDFLFAQEAQRRGYVSEAQVEEGLLLQKRMQEELRIDERLAVILVKRGWLAEEQARRVHERVRPAGQHGEIDGYSIVERIGGGAMGTVYKAIHRGLGKPVAIKILRRDLARDPVQTERLREEAKILASLDHPNIVRALDAGESAGFPFVVMEYVEGESLKDRVARRGPFREVEALRIVRAIADALERARRMGVVHRDVKPGNIVLSRQGVPKLMDLGLAKGPVDQGLTQYGATVGTPQFISPEQAQDPRRANTRSDIYSLGATLYAMLTGRPPFRGSTLAEVLTKVLYQEPTPIRVLNKQISPDAAYLVQRMMLKDPGLRYRTPAEVRDDIDRILEGRSILPAGYRGNWEVYLLRRRVRRWTRIAVGGVLAVILLGAVGFWVRERQQRVQRLEEGAQAVRQALDDTRPLPTDSAAKVRAKLATATAVWKQVAALKPPGGQALKERLEVLTWESSAFERITKKIEPHVRELEAAHRYGAAVAYLEQEGRAIGERGPPARRSLRALVARVRGSSRNRAEKIVEQATSAPVPDLDTMEVNLAVAKAALEADLIVDPDVKRARRDVADVLGSLRAIRARLRQVETAFDPASLRPKFASWALRDIRRDFETARTGILGFVEEAWRPLDPLGYGRVGQVRRLVERRLDAVDLTIDQGVEACWSDLKEEVGVLVRAGRVDDAFERLTRFQDAASLAGYGEFRRAAAALRDTIRGDAARAGRQAARALEAVEATVRGLLRDGRPDAIRATVEALLASKPATWPPRSDVESFLTLADAQEALFESALDALAASVGKRRFENVRLRNGSLDRRWIVAEVDRATRRIRVALSSRSSAGERRLADVAPEQIAAWATPPGGALPPLERAVALLMGLPEEEPADLRQQVSRLGAIREAFAAAGTKRGLAAWVDQAWVKVRMKQRQREDDTRQELQNANYYITTREYSTAYWHLGRVLQEGSPLRFTRAFEEREAEIRASFERVKAELDNLALAARFPGARITADGDRTSLTLDFDSEAQLEIFRRDPARASGILEPYVSPDRVVTPGRVTNYRFHLLAGMEGLVRARPLVLPDIFDPAAPIVVEFDLFTLKSPFFHAIDVDGIQVGILSADPTSPAYREWWRFPSDVPLLKDEKVVPRVNGYGRGRGVAFHSGPSFGDPTDPVNWSWPEAGYGVRFASWGRPGKRKLLSNELFAFQPGRSYRVKVVRDRGRITFFVDGREVASRERQAWAHWGGASDRDPKIRSGTGLIQILTWTPQAIDNLTVSGIVLKRWR
ncbi:MAG: protein kinase [Planctomycetota bacterium]